jgi:CheY-like chemotaxis protein
MDGQRWRSDAVARLEGIPVPKILVADDNANIQKMVALAFEERGIQVVSVGNGEAAVRRIPDLAPDLVLADIFMPVRNGYEVCEFVKKDERFTHVPVILLVGAFDPLDEKEARRVGADGVLKKPFVPPDPLIAMVTSALEKNPKVAAEMARAREAKEAPPEPEPPKLEIPTRAEPKPLPEYPEPSPEEAALVYGFGKGVRALDDDQIEAAAGPRPPVAEKEESDDDSEFDAASTSSDWRRNAMDFEVPAESANMPAFAEGHLESGDFPSEAEYPPRRVRVPEPVEEPDPVVQDSAPVTPPAPEPVITEAVPVEPASVIPASSETAAAPADEHSTVKSIWSKLWGKSEPAREPEPEPARHMQEAPAPEPVLNSPLSELPAAAHWMDALAPNQLNATGGDWMNTLSTPPANPPAASVPVEEPVESPEEAAPVESAAWSEPQNVTEAHTAVELPAPQDLFPVSHAVHEEQPVIETPAETPAPVEASAPVAHEGEAAESWFAPTPSVFRDTPDPVSEMVPVAHSEPDRDLELDSVDGEMPVALRDPALIESAAVHVTPEPLLVESDDASQGPSEYTTRPQEVSPLHSYFSPASGDRGADQPATEEPSFAAREEMQVPSFDPPAEDQASERIPTGPPPNMEALASIPFLTPPPEFRADKPESPAAANQASVDEVVRKVLERLEPQIHDLLSQGVLKPLVENLLQNELAKKDK